MIRLILLINKQGKVRLMKFYEFLNKCEKLFNLHIQLKNISLHDLHLIDTDTGENITQEVIDALPKGTETVDFKITVELPEEE